MYPDEEKIQIDSSITETTDEKKLNSIEHDAQETYQKSLQDSITYEKKTESLLSESKKLFSENTLSLSEENNTLVNSLENDKLSENNLTPNINDHILLNKSNQKNKMIDVLIYGTMHHTYTYRNTLISELQKINSNKYNIFVSGDLYGDELDEKLRDTKIVVHICSFADLEHMPWPKITYLQSKKVFYIIEDNLELHRKNLEDFVMTYQKGNMHDLFTKIEYYLTNETIREEIIEKNFCYVSKNFNMDIIIPDIIKSVINDI